MSNDNTKAILSTLAVGAAGASALSYLYKTSKNMTWTSFFANNSESLEYYLLAGDIGGTNSRLSLYCSSCQKTPLYENEYLNSQHITDASKTFEVEIFNHFLSECPIAWNDHTAIVACFAVAGPVNKNCVVMTNLGGHHTSAKKVDPTRMEVKIDGNSIESSDHGFIRYIKKCKVVNDFVGQGYGLLDLDLDREVVELVPGSRAMIDPNGVKACAGAGTGLGQCFLTQSSFHPEDGYECFASEGGHVDFVPRTELEYGLLNFLKEKFEQNHRVSVERVVSGKGLANVYEYLAKTHSDLVNTEVHEEFVNATDMQGRVVGVNANNESNPDPLCVQAMEIMMSAYGSEVGNCAVKFIPTGGLFVSGGLTPKNIKFIQGSDSPFMKAYMDKGRLATLLEGVPLFAVLVQDLGLRGARVCALRVSATLLPTF
jgi:glucokinase